MKDVLFPLKDMEDNNMLHLVGKCPKKKRLGDVSGVALDMQRELLWFKVLVYFQNSRTFALYVGSFFLPQRVLVSPNKKLVITIVRCRLFFIRSRI